MSVLGATTFQVQKWPRSFDQSDVNWNEIMRRRPITLANCDAVREHVGGQFLDVVGDHVIAPTDRRQGLRGVIEGHRPSRADAQRFDGE